MHRVNINKKSIRTDLILEQDFSKNNTKEEIIKNIKIFNSNENDNYYTTIYYEDITDKDDFKKVEEVLKKVLIKYIKPEEKDKFLIIGLGNEKSTPDSLGPEAIKNILVTSYLFALGEVEKGYSNVCAFSPSVTGNTGIETSDIIKSIIKEIKVNKVIIIDSLKTTNFERLNKTIQITNSGIHPGSGIGNTRKEISKKTLNCEVIAIGIPTVIDIKTIINEQKNLIVTPTNIDFQIEKEALLISNSINKILHKNFIRQNN